MYYLVIDQDNWGGCIPAPYGLTISAPTGIPLGTTCASPVVISSLPYSAVGETTACFGDDYNNLSTGSCGSWYESGEDKVYRYVATGPECIGVSLTNASTTSIGFQVYNGCPGAAGTTCVANYGGSSPLSGSAVLPGAGTYYIMVDTWASPMNAAYDISITSFGSGPANDLPCNAVALTLATPTSGDNTCSGGTGEPAWGACGWVGNLNSVWYNVVCPASGQLRVMTTLGTMYDSQIEVFSGTCGALVAVAGGCNDNATICTSGVNYYSLLTLTGLTPGATYWIRVDGYSNYTGSFSITASDGSIVPPPTVQDCSGSISVCGATSISQTVSYFGCGSTSDVPASGTIGNPSTNVSSANSGCLLSGERNSLWYRIDVSANGSLAWTISNPAGSIYDWILYPLTTNTCADISANLVAPVRCNWNGGSNTVGTGMQSPVPAGGIAANFETPLAVTAGQSYVLCVTNYSGTTGGTTIDFSNSTSGFGTPTTITWTGSTNTVWGTASNWGNCAPPSCTMNAVISPSTNQPVISVNSSVKDLTINAGATLTINAGITLTICGNFTNNGTLIASPTSTILFNNAAVTHTIDGVFTGTNKLGNLTITKTGGSVFANVNVDIGGNFLTSNATSIFNSNGKYIRVAGNFTNSSAGTTYTNSGTTGTLEFNGTAAQNYSPGGNLTLNHVLLNHTGTGVTLVGNNMILGTSGVLTLTLGKIITGALEVVSNNTASASVSAGNANSFVQGFLRRYILTTGSYDFPVGHATKGYQRANANFTAATTISSLLASFNPYGSVPAALGSTECGVTYNQPALDNGRWTITAYNAAMAVITGTGSYTMTLYNRAGSYTNDVGNTAWTVMKDPGSGWMLNGTCAASTVNTVARIGMSGFSNFGTAQSVTPLPIELLSFTGTSLGKVNQLDWTTASELNNDFFTLEHSSDGNFFEPIATVDGAGNSNEIKNYFFIDQSPYNGATYYKLKQTDFDGNSTYSNIVMIENHLDEISVSNIHPNPTSGMLNFDFFTPVKGEVTVVVRDLYGRVVYEKKSMVEDGNTALATDMGLLANGVYSLKVSMEEYNFFSVSKVVKH
ncbi:MAG: T9SS type A sorting domain-containing protein [Bacteroidota bacterium]|nr:T9SS type A sorting domain-containing protein [Bacteroidota bacterium]